MVETKQFTVYATFRAQDGKFAEMETLCRESFRLTKAASGVEQVICLEPPQPDKPFVFVSIWRDKADFQAFLQSPAMREFHSKTAVQKMFETAMQEATADYYSVMDAWSPVQ